MYTMSMKPYPVIVTTSRRPTPDMNTRATQLAEQFRCPRVQRFRKTIVSFLQYAHNVYMVGKNGRDMVYNGDSKQPFFFHPSMAKIRVQRLMNGEDDPLVSIARLQRGDSFLDLTLGLGADSIVASHIVTSVGYVVGVEKHQWIAEVVKRGLQYHREDVPGLNEAMRRITVVHHEHFNYLQSIHSNAFDIVYLDPMFSFTRFNTPHIRPLRAFADNDTVSEAVIEEAIRVSKRKVVLKAEQDSDIFERRGLQIQTKHRTVAYGTVDV